MTEKCVKWFWRLWRDRVCLERPLLLRLNESYENNEESFIILHQEHTNWFPFPAFRDALSRTWATWGSLGTGKSHSNCGFKICLPSSQHGLNINSFMLAVCKEEQPSHQTSSVFLIADFITAFRGGTDHFIGKREVLNIWNLSFTCFK